MTDRRLRLAKQITCTRPALQAAESRDLSHKRSRRRVSALDFVSLSYKRLRVRGTGADEPHRCCRRRSKWHRRSIPEQQPVRVSNTNARITNEMEGLNDDIPGSATETLTKVGMVPAFEVPMRCTDPRLTRLLTPKDPCSLSLADRFWGGRPRREPGMIGSLMPIGTTQKGGVGG